MNRDTHLIFEAYRNNRLDEMALRVKGEGDAVQSLVATIKQGIEERGKNNDTYLFKGFTGAELDKRINELVVPIIRDLFPNGTYEGKGSEKDLVKLERDIMTKLAASNPKAKSQYTARILKSFISTIVDEVESNVKTGETIQAAVEDIADAVVDGADKSDEVAVASAASGDTDTAAPAAAADRLTVRIEQLLADAVPHGGKLIKYVIDEVVHEIRNSGGLGIPEGKEKAKIEAVLKDLIDKKVLKKKGPEAVDLGDNFEAFEASGGNTSLMSDEDLITNVTGYGERPTYGRSFWANQE